MKGVPVQRIGVIARQEFEHDGRVLAEGEYFDVSAVEAVVLMNRRLAHLAPVTARKKSPPKRRQYRRRDMTAEP